jgi:hypothetical protein
MAEPVTRAFPVELRGLEPLTPSMPWMAKPQVGEPEAAPTCENVPQETAESRTPGSIPAQIQRRSRLGAQLRSWYVEGWLDSLEGSLPLDDGGAG